MTRPTLAPANAYSWAEGSGGNLGNYVRRFGFRRGLSLYAAMKWQYGAIEVDVPGLAGPLSVRAGTSDREAFVQIFALGEYDIPYPTRPHFIVDAGANVGYASVKFANLYPEAEIVAVEPDAGNCAVLKRNIEHYQRVRLVQAGVWPGPARLTIDNPEDKPWSFRVREAAPSEDAFTAVSIAQLLEQSGRSTIDILKLDVEGTERELFADPSSERWLSRTNMMFVETHDRLLPGCEEALNRAASRYPFIRSHHGENIVLIRQPLLT